MATINILGVPHAYELKPPTFKSSKPALIFIHGWLLSRNYWYPLMEQLSDEYRCLIYDLRGFGDSGHLPTSTTLENKNEIDSCLDSSKNNGSSSKYSLAAYAKDLSIILEKLEIDSAWLIGHSLGGNIAIWAAHYCQEKIKGVICLNSGGGIYLKEEFERFRIAGQQIVKKRPHWLSYIPLIDLVFARIMVARPLARHWGMQRVIDLIKANEEAALGALLDTTTETEVHLLPQIVSSLSQPVYFLAGTLDTVMELKYVKHLASFHQLFQNNCDNVIEIPNCGHLSMVEQPELVGTRIMNILEKYQS